MNIDNQGHVLKLKRHQLSQLLFEDPAKNVEVKLQHLQEYVLAETGWPLDSENSKLVKKKFSMFASKLKAKYFEAQRKKHVFYSKYETWLECEELFPSCKQVSPGPRMGPGRPSSSFDEVSERSKRRKVQNLLNIGSNELSFAASMKYRQEGEKKLADVIKRAPNATETQLGDCLVTLKHDCHQMLSVEKAFCVFLDGQLSVFQYNVIRDSAKDKFPPYKSLLSVKKQCYPPETAFSISETHVSVTLQGILDHTCNRIFKIISEHVNLEGVSHLKLMCKWGIDGTSGFTEYKQRFFNSLAKDSSMFVTSFVSLILYTYKNGQEKVIWKNQHPSSPRYCRPIHIQFKHETTELAVQEMNRVDSEIENLTPTMITTNNQSYLPVFADLLFTMTDGKVCNAVTETSSAQRCYICKQTISKFNKLNLMWSAPIVTENLRFGISLLHAWIRMFECLLHVSYKLPWARWRIPKPQLEERIKALQVQFKDRLGLIVDVAKPGYGNSNDGNTARRFFFRDLDESADITGISKNLIYRFHIILITLSSNHKINTALFDNYCRKTAVLFVKLYPWYYMPTSVHKILIHSVQIIENSLLPIGSLSEEAMESRNKDIKKFRENYARKTSREDNLRDVFNRLLVTSDPFISTIRKQPKSRKKQLPEDVTKMILFESEDDDSSGTEE